MLAKIFLSLLLTAIANGADYIHQPIHQYKLSDSISIDYLLVSHAKINQTSNIFFNSFDSNFIIDTIEGNETHCEEHCNEKKECNGYTSFFNNSQRCNLLTNISDYRNSNLLTSSYRKYIFHHPPQDEFNIIGLALTPNRNLKNISVYVDLNLNGMYDEGEPRNYTNNSLSFGFYGLKKNSYSIRIEEPYGCHQIFPGKFGYDKYVMSDGYVDHVLYYNDGGHLDHPGINGGIIGNNISNLSNVDFSFIQGSNSSTYLSFYDSNSIILSLSDEYIINMEGDDVFVDTYGNSSINGNVSVSYDGKNYYFLGELNDNKKSFDLDDIEYEKPVKYVRIIFHCDMSKHHKDMPPRNIISIYGYDNPFYSPSFSSYVSPVELTPIFVYDCESYYSCGIYCHFLVNQKKSESCIHGCEQFINKRNCNCHNVNVSDLSFNRFRVNECEMGCSYQISQELYPNYTVFMNADGIGNDMNKRCKNNETCFDNSLVNCNNDDNCHSISMYRERIKEFNTLRHIYKKHSLYIVKNKILKGQKLTYHTTTPTTTPTSTPTFTQTTTPTVTETTTPTFTQTTTPTFTQTTTPTFTQTTTPTFTQTTTEILTTTTISKKITTMINKNSLNPTYTVNPTTTKINQNTISLTTDESSSTTITDIKKSDDKKTFNMAFIIGIILSILIIVVLIFLWMIIDHRRVERYNQNNQPNRNELISFENPIYERDIVRNNELYKENHQTGNLYNDLSPHNAINRSTSNPNFAEDEYLDIQPNDE